jgi:serine/threonine protein kinase
VGISRENKSAADPSTSGADGPARSLAPGTIVADRYRIIEFLAEGGMGAVYRADHLHMRKSFALKVLHRSLVSNPEVVARFEREAIAAGNIDHPNVVCATDFGRLPDDSFFLVLEFVRGRSLRDVLDAGALEPARAVRIMRGIVAGVGAAHSKGIVHRDLKPENIMLVDRDGDRDFVKVLDFGIAKVDLSAPGGREGGAAPLTAIGSVIGTPEYMAPEQALGGAVDARSDLYSLGVIFYELLAGHCPFVGPAVAVLQRHVVEPPPPFSEDLAARLDPRIGGIVRKLLSKRPEDRFDSASNLAAALTDVAAPRPTVVVGPTWRRPLLARIGLAVSIGIVAWVVVRSLMGGSDRAETAAPQPLPGATDIGAPRATDSTPLVLPPPPEPQASTGATPRPGTSAPAQTSPASRGPARRRTGPGGIYIPPPRDWFK